MQRFATLLISESWVAFSIEAQGGFYFKPPLLQGILLYHVLNTALGKSQMTSWLPRHADAVSKKPKSW